MARFLITFIFSILLTINFAMAGSKNKKKLVIYPDILITQAADFVNFKRYMEENKESYRARRSAELAIVSQGLFGTDPVLVDKMMVAYKQFDSDYERDRAKSAGGLGKDLVGQLMAAMDRLKEQNLLSDQETNWVFSYGNRSGKAMHNRLAQYRSDLYEEDRVDVDDIMENSNAFLYGYWSYFSHPRTNEKGIKITMTLEPIGGNIKTFEAIGSAQGGAMQGIAMQLFDHLQAMRNYDSVSNPQPQLKILRPLSYDDSKTHDEAEEYCNAQSNGKDQIYRLPYAREILNMPGKYFEGGAVFVDLDKRSYAVADRKGGIDKYKVVPLSRAGEKSRVMKSGINEQLGYFCVAGEITKGSEDIDDLYTSLYERFRLFKEKTGGKIDKETCQDLDDNLGMSEVKDLAVMIRSLDRAAKLKAVIKGCVKHYLDARNTLSDELYMISVP